MLVNGDQDMLSGGNPEPSLLTARRWVWLATALLWIAILATNHSQVALIVEAWQTLPSHAHGSVVLLVVAYLVWTKRKVLAGIPLTPSKIGIAALVLSGAAGFAGEMVSAAVVSQFALVFMLQAAVWTVMGGRAFRILFGPLCFLLFAIPFGHDVLPTLMDWTANATVIGLRASGVPVLQENRYFVIPSGSWSVVEACSGIRYLLTSFFVGSIFAYITYTGWVKRLAFVVWMVLISVFANWLRAYLIVMTAHLTNNQWGLGMSHLTLGWVLFGVVMIGSFAIGNRWHDPQIRVENKPLGTAASMGSTAIVALISLGVILGWGQLVGYFNNLPQRPVPVLDLSNVLQGLEEVQPTLPMIVPQFIGSSVTHKATYRYADGEIGLTIAYYRNQQQGTELINVRNLLEPTHSWAWRKSEHWAPLAPDVPDFRVESYFRPDAHAVVATVYWIGGWTTSSEVLSKIYQAINLLRGGGDDGAMIVITASDPLNDEVPKARIEAFIRDRLPNILKYLDAVRANPGQ